MSRCELGKQSMKHVDMFWWIIWNRSVWSRGRCRRIKRSHSHGTLNVYKFPMSTRSSVRHWSVTPAWAKVSSVQESQTKSIPCRQLSHMWPALLILALSVHLLSCSSSLIQMLVAITASGMAVRGTMLGTAPVHFSARVSFPPCCFS